MARTLTPAWDLDTTYPCLHCGLHPVGWDGGHCEDCEPVVAGGDPEHHGQLQRIRAFLDLLPSVRVDPSWTARMEATYRALLERGIVASVDHGIIVQGDPSSERDAGIAHLRHHYGLPPKETPE